jgi:REase_MTES_1575/AAA domain
MSVIPLTSRADDVRDRAVRLFTFLQEYTQLRARTVLTTDGYEEVLWLADVAGLPGCFSAASDPAREGGEVWLEVRKPKLRPVPQPPVEVLPWLAGARLDDSRLDAPELRGEIPDPDAPPPPVPPPAPAAEVGPPPAAETPPPVAETTPDTEPPPPDQVVEAAAPAGSAPAPVLDPPPPPPAPPEPPVLRLADHPGVRAAWAAYVRDEWTPWAERDRVLQRAQRVYTDLFRVHQSQQRLGEAYEVVLGLGQLAWRVPHGDTISRHVVVAQADVRFDADRGLITVAAPADGARPALEHDMLEPDERPPRDVLDAIAADLAGVGDDVFADPTVVAAIRRWAHGLSAGARFEDGPEPQREVTRDPVVRLAPALVLRRRSDRSVVQALATIAEQLRLNGPIPEGVRRLVDVGDAGPADPAGDERPAGEEILFPLPANDAQLDIVRRLRDRPGIVVQGPPGTGKSHTIANLVAHLLARGERVLVTSHTARALEVLRNRIPDEIRELAVVVLGNDARGRDELQASVRGISDRYATWDPRRSQARIVRCREELEAARSVELDLRARLRALRERDGERRVSPFGAFEGTPQEIAWQLRSAAPELGWLPDRVDVDAEPPLTDAEAAELLGLLRAIDPQAEAELRTVTARASDLPSPEAFAALVAEERSATVASEDAEDAAPARPHPAAAALAATPPETVDVLAAAIVELRRQRQALVRRGEPWVRAATDQVAGGVTGRWRVLERATDEALTAVRPLLAQAATQVTGVEGRSPAAVRADAEQLMEHLRSGGGLGRGPLRPAPVRRARYVVDGVRVDGQPCTDLAALSRLAAWAAIQDRLDRLDAEWASQRPPATGSAPVRCAEYEDVLTVLRSALGLEAGREAAAGAVAAVPGLAVPDWEDDAALTHLLQAVDSARRERRLRAARRALAGAEAALGAGSHPVAGQLRAAVEVRDQLAYEAAYASLVGLDANRAALARRRELQDRLAAAAPGLAGLVAASRSDPEWDARLPALSAAWAWARTDAWLARQADPAAVARLERDLDDVRQRIERATRSLAAELAWAHCLGRLTESERAHLETWEEAVRKIGKGTGKHAPRWRQRAREAMQGCRSAIPAWIMPIFKVAEAVDMAPEAFDVVIVDEASQSGPEALFLQYLARKVIVVGDDQQISPDNVGVDRDKVQLLNAQYLRDVPLAMHYDADTSYFTHAAIRYGDRLVLQEHFRCMPEIIQFSNGLCYQDRPLVPLRQFGSDRLQPAIQVRHVDGGVYDDARVNEAEARAVVEQVLACLADPAYAGRTFGVVSLVGPEQARLIARLLTQHVDPAEMERRRLLCGDAYAFQGDERDVMFLSLVQAPREGHRLYAGTAGRDRRRFNVAASRARDQLWLFHTAALEDLHPEGVAYRLLRYCLQPAVEPAALEDGQALAGWRRRAVERLAGDEPPHPFESWLEVDVLLRLAERGFRVIPQHDLAGYRIDLLVEGLRSRLAVECDGDRWPGESVFEAMLLRQRMLQRCGLPFSRVRGAAFYRDPDAALEPLWADLQQHDIGPRALSPPTGHQPGS